MDSYKIELDRFYRDIYKYLNDYNIYIIKPKATPFEDYVMSLEYTISRDYGVDIRNSRISYVDIRDQDRDPYLPDVDTVILYDPMCWVEEILRYKNKLDKIGELLDGY